MRTLDYHNRFSLAFQTLENTIMGVGFLGRLIGLILSKLELMNNRSLI